MHLEQALQDLKEQSIPKKEVQVIRNRLSAQLSRDKTKVRMDTLLRQNAELLRETTELRAYVHEHQSDLLKVRDTLKTHLCQ